MKNKKLYVAAIAAIVTVAGYNANHSYNKISKVSNLALENIEALADVESGTSSACWNKVKNVQAAKVFYCGTCSWVPGEKIRAQRYCN